MESIFFSRYFTENKILSTVAVKNKICFFLKRFLIAFCIGFQTSQCHAAMPVVNLPPHAIFHELGQPVVVNGLQIQASGFSSLEKPEKVTEWFRSQLGTPLSQRALGRRMVLGRLINGYYVTVQIEATAPGTKGLIGISNLESAARERPQYENYRREFSDRLPKDSRIINHISSNDSGRSASQWLYTNSYGVQANEIHIVEMFKREGLAMQYRNVIDEKGGSVILQFGSKGREVSASILPAADKATSVYIISTLFDNKKP